MADLKVNTISVEYLEERSLASMKDGIRTHGQYYLVVHHQIKRLKEYECDQQPLDKPYRCHRHHQHLLSRYKDVPLCPKNP